MNRTAPTDRARRGGGSVRTWTIDRDVDLLHAVDVVAAIRVVVGVVFLLVLVALVGLAADKGHEDRCERLRDQSVRYEQLCGASR